MKKEEKKVEKKPKSARNAKKKVAKVKKYISGFRTLFSRDNYYLTVFPLYIIFRDIIYYASPFSPYYVSE